MSARSGIPKALATLVENNFKGTDPYVTNIYGNVDNVTKHFDNVNDFPYISVTPGPELRDDQPSNVTISTLTVYFRIYVENEDDAQGELETIISDIETLLDTNLVMPYNITTPSGEVVRNTLTNSIVSIQTDEGILDPNAMGQVMVNIKYEKIRQT